MNDDVRAEWVREQATWLRNNFKQLFLSQGVPMSSGSPKACPSEAQGGRIQVPCWQKAEPWLNNGFVGKKPRKKSMDDLETQPIDDIPALSEDDLFLVCTTFVIVW